MGALWKERAEWSPDRQPHRDQLRTELTQAGNRPSLGAAFVIASDMAR